MFNVLKILGLASLITVGCSKNDQQSAGAKIPPPGSDHLAQIFVMADRVGSGGLALDFLANSASAVPDAKLYVSRPSSFVEAENELRAWSARSMDWLFIAGPIAREAFLKTKISWTNTRHIIITSDSTNASLRQDLGTKLNWLLFSDKTLSDWSDSYCSESNKWPECEDGEKDNLFAWAHDFEAKPRALINIAWNWASFFATVMKSSSKNYSLSFDDGFLTLSLRARAVQDKELSERLNTWIKLQAFKGLSNQ